MSDPSRADAAARTGRLRILLASVAVAGYALDRVTKILAERHLEGRPPIDLIDGVLRLRFATNPGGAFGLFGGATWLFLLASVAVVIVVIVAARKLPSRTSAVGLGLILAGALGNLTDRAIRGPSFSGEVVDFIDLHVWPVFNVADSCIVVGAGLLLVAGFGSSGEER
ncbi:MAG TPA: signal peptidase II [Actinomycetota bacterium]|nr:signal peptidase II [Actinomycetota bacterium]